MENIFDELAVHGLREKFKGEASDFTPWLTRNLDKLSDAIGMNISNPEREQRLETMKVDIVAEAGDNGGDKIIIENQFGDSNHDHLGKLLCYAAYTGAQYAVWIVERAREEHIKAVEMLNEANDLPCGFYLVEAVVYTIGDSKPAIAFNVVCKPAEVREKQQQQQKTPAQVVLYEFWEKFLEYVKKNSKHPFADRKPLHQNWLDVSSGTSAIHYEFFMRKGKATVSVLCDGATKEQNKRNFRLLESEQKEIEEKLGFRPLWCEMEDNKLSKISISTHEFGGYEKDKEKEWPQLFAWMLEKYEKFAEVFSPFTSKIKGATL